MEAMEAELNIEPLDVYINKRIGKFSLKFRTITTEHPLQKINPAMNQKRSFLYKSKILLSDGNNQPQKIPPVNETPPWQWMQPTIRTTLEDSVTKQNTDPLVLRAIAQQIIAENYNQYVHIYMDGSLDTQGKRSGAGYFIPSTQESFLVPANSCSSVDTELLAINAALTCCLTLHLSLIHI